MTRSITRAEIIDGAIPQISSTQHHVLTHGLCVSLFLSLFLLVYVNFANRVNTVRLNHLMEQSQSLYVQRDKILLEKEQLQMHHQIEKKAQSVHGFVLAKKAKVVNIKL